MGLGYRNLSSSQAEFVRTYKDISGVDFSGLSLSSGKCRLPYAENMYRDYTSGDYILESIPGYRELFKFGERINGIFCHRISEGEEYIIVHAGTKLYRFSLAERDSGAALSPICTLLNTRSAGFPFGDSFYILDGERIYVISREGTADSIDTEGGLLPYIPTRFKNGVEYEQANLLCDEFKEEISLTDYKNYTYGSEGLIYARNPDGSLSVIGADASISGVIHIPSRIKLAGEYRDITKIQDLAFLNRNEIDAVITNEGLERIGAGAFKGCKNLSYFIISDTVESLGDGAFEGCETLTELYIGTMCHNIGQDVFSGCVGFNTVRYAGAESEYIKILGAEYISAENIIFGSRYRNVDLRLPVFSSTTKIDKVTVGEGDMQFYTVFKDGLAVAVDVSFKNRDTLLGSTALIRSSSEVPTGGGGDGSDIRNGKDPALFSGGCAIKKCTKAALFDGRVFLCGNPDMPNVVFFSSDEDPMFFGSLDYFADGGSGYGISSLLPAQDNLIVFKSADDGSGSIFYHRKEKNEGSIRDVSYPASFTNNAIPSLGDSAIFYDDAVFISELGICGLEKSTLGGVKAVCRSHNVNQRLLSEDFKSLRLASWQGYLVVCAGERMYLADSRSTFNHPTGGKEYEWFFLSGVGASKQTRRMYYFESYKYGDLNIYEGHEGEPAITYPVYSIPTNGALPAPRLYGALVGDKLYHIYRSNEVINGDVHKCTEVLGVGELLFFGCENGSLMLFNNDKRGEIPTRLLTNDPELDTEAYKKSWGNKIHPEFYSFAGRSPRYTVRTGMDCCDIPYLEKNTTPASVSIKYKSLKGGKIRCECATDRENGQADKGFSVGEFSFDTLSFGNMSFEGSRAPFAVCYRAPKRWVEKEITLTTDAPASPIGIYSLSYRFKIKGRIKNR